MIKFECDNKNGKMTLKAEGNLSTICTDTCMLLHQIYSHLKGDDDGRHEMFAHCIKKAVQDGIVFGGDDNDDDCDKKDEGGEGFELNDLIEFLDKAESLLKKLKECEADK